MKKLIGLVCMLLLLVLLGCAREPPPPSVVSGKSETLGSGYVRSVDWYHSTFLYETDDGVVKQFGPICYPANGLPVWQGMHLNRINFHWDTIRFENGVFVCFKLDYIEHSKSGDIQ